MIRWGLRKSCFDQTRQSARRDIGKDGTLFFHSFLWNTVYFMYIYTHRLLLLLPLYKEVHVLCKAVDLLMVLM